MSLLCRVICERSLKHSLNRPLNAALTKVHRPKTVHGSRQIFRIERIGPDSPGEMGKDQIIHRVDKVRTGKSRDGADIKRRISVKMVLVN